MHIGTILNMCILITLYKMYHNIFEEKDWSSQIDRPIHEKNRLVFFVRRSCIRLVFSSKCNRSSKLPPSNPPIR